MSANHATKRSASSSRAGRSVTSFPRSTGPNMAAQNRDKAGGRSRIGARVPRRRDTVTGSQFLLTTDRARVLVDCRMFQGSPNEVTRNRLPFAFAPREVDALLLTHAHLDHCGLIPALVADGFAGPIYATAGTVELAGLVLLDAAKLEFAKRSERRARRQHPPTSDPEAELRAQGPWVETAHEEPLYTEADVMSALARFRGEWEARRRRGLPARGLHHARRPARRDRAQAEGPRARIRDERRAMARDGDAGLGDRALRERGGEEHLVAALVANVELRADAREVHAERVRRDGEARREVRALEALALARQELHLSQDPELAPSGPSRAPRTPSRPRRACVSRRAGRPGAPSRCRARCRGSARPRESPSARG